MLKFACDLESKCLIRGNLCETLTDSYNIDNSWCNNYKEWKLNRLCRISEFKTKI